MVLDVKNLTINTNVDIFESNIEKKNLPSLLTCANSEKYKLESIDKISRKYIKFLRQHHYDNFNK